MIAEKKKRSVFHNVSFRIEPSEGEANCFTIYKLEKVSTDLAEEPTSDPCKLNHKYKKRLYGWISERRQCENRAFDMVGVVETRSMKRKEECSISKRESTIKKHKSKNFDKRVKVFLVDKRNNSIGVGIGHREVHRFDNKLWEALLATTVMEQ
uniref:Uncharacterized protein n=1 Tax=Solanum tuberosum TaxID=4113 RepID=M1D8J9_SOLTU